jgi:hypothetical protein
MFPESEGADELHNLAALMRFFILNSLDFLQFQLDRSQWRLLVERPFASVIGAGIGFVKGWLHW